MAGICGYNENRGAYIVGGAYEASEQHTDDRETRPWSGPDSMYAVEGDDSDGIRVGTVGKRQVYVIFARKLLCELSIGEMYGKYDALLSSR